MRVAIYGSFEPFMTFFGYQAIQIPEVSKEFFDKHQEIDYVVLYDLGNSVEECLRAFMTVTELAHRFKKVIWISCSPRRCRIR